MQYKSATQGTMPWKTGAGYKIKDSQLLELLKLNINFSRLRFEFNHLGIYVCYGFCKNQIFVFTNRAPFWMEPG